MMMLLASFGAPEALLEAAKAMQARSIAVIDAFTPFPVEGIGYYLPPADRGIRTAMLATFFCIAGCCYLLEWWTAVVDYPFNSGGRPLNSWPVFLLFPFEFGVLSAAIAGLIAFFVKTKLPRYHDPLFESDLIARSSVDAFILAVAVPEEQRARDELMMFLARSGADHVREIRA